MSKVDQAIEMAYGVLTKQYERCMKISDFENLTAMSFAIAMLKPYVENPWLVFHQARREWWIDQMEIHFSEKFKNFSKEQIESMLDWLEEWDIDQESEIEDALYGALEDNDLLSLVERE